MICMVGFSRRSYTQAGIWHNLRRMCQSQDSTPNLKIVHSISKLSTQSLTASAYCNLQFVQAICMCNLKTACFCYTIMNWYAYLRFQNYVIKSQTPTLHGILFIPVSLNVNLHAASCSYGLETRPVNLYLLAKSKFCHDYQTFTCRIVH